MDEQFNKCPNCKGTDIESTDYEGADGEIEDDGVRCNTCDWEGYTDALVCE